MPRGVKRTWVKLDCHGVLHGSINWLFTLEEQAVFLKLIPMAAVYCQTPGIISDNSGNPLPREFIAHELHCPVEVLNSVITKGCGDSCLKETDEGLELTNFRHYQFTEYDRQRPYREAKKAQATEAEEPEDEQPHKKPHGEFQNVLLTDEEFTKLTEKLGHRTGAEIEKLSAYMKSKGKRYKDHYATILSWTRRDDGKAKHSRKLPTYYEPTADYPDL